MKLNQNRFIITGMILGCLCFIAVVFLIKATPFERAGLTSARVAEVRQSSVRQVVIYVKIPKPDEHVRLDNAVLNEQPCKQKALSAAQTALKLSNDSIAIRLDFRRPSDPPPWRLTLSGSGGGVQRHLQVRP